MDQISGQWGSTFMEHNGKLELVIVFETKDNNQIAISYNDLKSVVGTIQEHLGKKGSLSLFPLELQVKN